MYLKRLGFPIIYDGIFFSVIKNFCFGPSNSRFELKANMVSDSQLKEAIAVSVTLS